MNKFMKYLFVFFYFLLIFSSVQSQVNDLTYQDYPFQVIDRQFILTRVGNQIVEIVNRVEYLSLKESNLLSFVYDKKDTSLLTLEENGSQRNIIYRSRDVETKQKKNKIRFPTEELPYKLVESNEDLFIATISDEQSNLYSFSKGALSSKLFSTKHYITDIFFNTLDSFYYFASGLAIYKIIAGQKALKTISVDEKVCRLIQYKNGLLLSTTNHIYYFKNNKLKILLNRGGYFDIVSGEIYGWEMGRFIKIILDGFSLDIETLK